MKTFKPSKILNIKSNCLGLTLDDLLGLMVFYTFFQLLFASIGLEILSIILTFFTALFLIPIRLILVWFEFLSFHDMKVVSNKS